MEAIKGLVGTKKLELQAALDQGLCPTYEDDRNIPDWGPGFTEERTNRFESYMPCTADNCSAVGLNAAVGVPHYENEKTVADVMKRHG